MAALEQLLLPLLKAVPSKLKRVAAANGIYLISVLTRQCNPGRAACAEPTPLRINQSATFRVFLSAEGLVRLLYEKKLVFTGCAKAPQLLLQLN